MNEPYEIPRPNRQIITFTIYENESVTSTIQHEGYHDDVLDQSTFVEMTPRHTLEFMKFLCDWEGWPYP